MIKWQIVQRGCCPVLTLGHEEQRTKQLEDIKQCLKHAVMSHKGKKRGSDLTFERSSLCSSLWDATCMTPGMKRCWKEWHQSWEPSTSLLAFYVQSRCVFMSPVWATIVRIWKNGFGEAVPQQSGSGVVYMTGTLMQLMHWGWSLSNGTQRNSFYKMSSWKIGLSTS